MQNRKFDKWFEQIILVFAYFFLFLLYNIGLSSLFWKSEMNLPAYAKNPLYILFLEHKEDSLLTRVAWGMVR